MTRRVRFSPLSIGLLGAAALVSSPPSVTAADVPFTEHTISTAANFAFSVFAADVNGDGDTDVLSASGFDDKIAWYENDGSENFTTHTISTAADAAWSVFAADVDGDGDTDVLSASWVDIAWYESNLPFFADGFEAGDTTAWSSTVP